MCGFVTVVRTDSGPPIDREALDRMRDSLAHRGPDDATTEIVDDWVGLGFRRLAIIDVVGAKQPLRNEDGQVVCTFNGEIYNFVELRNRLLALGHTFATSGDGEVIVHGYEEWGTGVFARLEGMFAITLVDRRSRRVFLARDRFGIKPMFYRAEKHAVYAASELKAIIGSRIASTTALRLGAMRLHVPWPLTAFDGIYRVPPGAVLEVQASGATKLHRFAAMTDVGPRERETSVDEVLAELTNAVRRQMVADVPVGAFLSGGVDSTLIVALMRGLTNAAVHTFSIKTVDHDESDVAEVTARRLGTTHHTIGLEDISFDDLAELPRLYDEPFAETSALGVRALSRFAREHVTVALSGDGGDEVFGGYSSYRWIRSASRVPVPSRSRVSGAAHELLTRRRWPPRLRRLLRGMLLISDSPATAQRDVTTLSWAAGAPERDLSEELSRRIDSAFGSPRTSAVRLAMLADRFERLPNAMLAKVDIASMSASLEVRVPMLDDALVRFADQIPTHQLLDLRHGKLLLRECLARQKVGSIAWDTKRGFSLPLARWMQSTRVAPRLRELYGDHRSTLHELVGVDVEQLWSKLETGRSRYSDQTAAEQLLWFANVALWADRFGVTSARNTAIADLPIA